MACIYKIVNQINQKMYIGQTTVTVERRWQKHISDSKRKELQNRPLYKAFNKYGIENFLIEIIEECSNDILAEREKFWILHFNTCSGEGYNATFGGDGSRRIDVENIINLYEETKSIREVSRITGHTRGAISKILECENINTKFRNVDENLILEKNKEGLSIREVHKVTGYSTDSIIRVLKKNNIKTDYFWDYDLIVQEYNKLLTSEKVVKKLGCGQETVAKALKEKLGKTPQELYQERRKKQKIDK